MNASDFEITQVRFEKPRKFKKVAGAHIINVRYEDPSTKTRNPLSVHTPIMFSFGAQASTFQDSSDNWSMSLVCFDACKGPTPEETKFMNVLTSVEDKVKSHLKDPAVKKLTGKWYVDPLIDMMSVFYRKMEDGVPVPDRSPVLYPKLLKAASAAGVCGTGFYKIVKGKEVKIPIVKDKCRVVCDFLIDSVFLGAKPSIQIKLVDVLVVENIGVRRKTLKFSKLPSAVQNEISKMADDEQEESSTEEEEDEEDEYEQE
ncbi:unknown protein [Grouper iridovirus]|uniref:P31K protein n=1 Tax=Grouper iridovirus TaxID=127569 RepID=Q5GAC0_9VIRU|nr:unknown protein [Grouper iridovirus]